ncbi:MAG TPA: response regulator [Candidatus Saccharimonadales bacterium]|nr:response regulator [Candidatus Saccharimonadales bacterium]
MKKLPRVLLVDDEADYLFVARRALHRACIQAEIQTAADGGEVLRLLGLDTDPGVGSPPEGLAVILLDINMPGLDGIEVLRRIRFARRTRDIPVVMVSSSDRPDEVRLSYQVGANSFIVKRFDRENPGAYVAEAARYWIDLNRPPAIPRDAGA